MRISHDPRNEGSYRGGLINERERAAVPSMNALLEALHELQPASIAMAPIGVRQCTARSDGSGVADGARIKWSGGFVRNVHMWVPWVAHQQWQNIADCFFEQVLAHERTRRLAYRWVVRARFDARFFLRLPPLAVFEARIKRMRDADAREPIILARNDDEETQGRGGSYRGGANPFAAEFHDRFAIVARRHAATFFGFARSPLWCSGDDNMRRQAAFCGKRHGPECMLAVHLASQNLSRGSVKGWRISSCSNELAGWIRGCNSNAWSHFYDPAT